MLVNHNLNEENNHTFEYSALRPLILIIEH